MMTTTQRLCQKAEQVRAQKPRLETEVSVSLTVSQLRRLTGLPQVHFAAAIGVTKGYLSMIESGKRQPSEAVVRRIYELINMRVAA